MIGAHMASLPTRLTQRPFGMDSMHALPGLHANLHSSKDQPSIVSCALVTGPRVPLVRRTTSSGYVASVAAPTMQLRQLLHCNCGSSYTAVTSIRAHRVGTPPRTACR